MCFCGQVSENILSIYLDEYEETPWEALRYLIANINYGGHVTDDMDRRLLLTYVADFFQEDVLTTPFFRLSALNYYYIPRDGAINSYKEYISMLPNMDHPEAFGQHPNADITSQITETRMVFGTLLGLQPQIVTGAGESREDKVRKASSHTQINRLHARFLHYFMVIPLVAGARIG